jgi:hypothetical protein
MQEFDGTAVETLRLNAHHRLRRESGTRQFKGIRCGGVERLAARSSASKLLD